MQPTVVQFGPVTVHTFVHPSNGWTLSVATNARPQANQLSLGGFRIAPKALVDEPGFDAVAMAASLAAGMEEKVYWSRIIGVGGPLALRDMSRIVGGKCVLVPTDDARVGEPPSYFQVRRAGGWFEPQRSPVRGERRIERPVRNGRVFFHGPAHRYRRRHRSATRGARRSSRSRPAASA